MNRQAARRIAEFLLDGPWSVGELLDRWRSMPRVPGRTAKWLPKLIDRLVAAISDGEKVDLRSLALLLQNDSIVNAILSRHRSQLEPWAASLSPAEFAPPRMTPILVAREWAVPAIETPGKLAEILTLTDGHLQWLADPKGLERTCEQERLRNYRYHWVRKASGGLRLLEAPKAKLKNSQRWIANNVLNQIPVHPAAHAFAAQRSPQTAAVEHCRQAVVLRIDLCDFFPSIYAPRVAGIFRTAGYPSSVVRLLTGLCVNTAWRGIVDGFSTDGRNFGIRTRDARVARLFQPHLSQGSPASPMLSNLAAWKLDCRLSGLAQRFSARYTRYADDLIFSGDQQFGNELREFRLLVCAICLDEGFEIRHRKTQIMRAHQQQKVVGLVVNESPAVSRRDFDTLKATLHNCRRLGPASQNHDALPNYRMHLAGRIAWVRQTNSTRGDKLQAIFDSISWAQEKD